MTTVNIAGDGREEDESSSENEDDLVFDYLGITEEDDTLTVPKIDAKGNFVIAKTGSRVPR